MLEVLATFENQHGQVTWDRVDAINFQLHGWPYHMTCIEFALYKVSTIRTTLEP